jgi:hypothetical protein
MNTNLAPSGFDSRREEGQWVNLQSDGITSAHDLWHDLHMPAKTHILLGSVAAILAIPVSLVLATHGSHGKLGLIAIWVGYPGGFANWKLNPPRVSYGLITAVNWFAYFVLLEASLAVKRGISH